jgi:glycosyltransferase involved in cell wall biosynthesis
MRRTSQVPNVCFAIPGNLSTLTGGYVYARRVMEALPGAGWFPQHVTLPSSFPHPSAHDLAITREILSQLPADAPVLIDGLAYGALPRDLLEDLDVPYVALVHHPLAQETGLTDAEALRLKNTEKAALELCASVIVTSPHTAETLAQDYGVARHHIYIATPGTDPASRATGSGAVPRLLTVATLTHRKGHDVLIEALSQIQDVPWSSVLVGSEDRDPEVATQIKALIDTHGLRSRVTLAGELRDQALNAAYGDADVFVLPSRHEGYGMVFAEALARGLPIVACDAGAVRETVPADSGILVPPGDSSALAQALRRVLGDQASRRKLSDAAWQQGQDLPRWSDTAAMVAEALWAAVP